MNSFGHSVAAAWERQEPRFVLGAMLPDLGMLIGARLAAAGDEATSAGIAQHHRVDAVFHALPAFTEWWKEAAAELVDAGFRRHAARAASHVAIELFLDGELAREPAHAPPFLSAMKEAAKGPEPSWRLPPERGWGELVERLSGAGVPHHLREAEAVARRVEGALGRRPRLRLEDSEIDSLGDWARRVAAGVGPRAGLLAEDLREALRD